MANSTTYQDKKGTYFDTHDEAAASNKALGSVLNSNTITSENLKGSGQSLILPDPVTSTYGGLSGAMEGIASTAKSAAQQNVDNLKSNVNDTGNAYLKELLGSAGIESSVDRTEQDKFKKESDRTLAVLETEQLANRRAIEGLQKNFKGTTAGLDAAITAQNRKSLSTQADAALLHTVANRDYDTAKSIADREVEMKLEQSKIKLSALKFFYDENKDAFDKADDRLYSEAVKKADREYKIQEDIETKIRDLKLNVAQFAGASASGILSSLSAIDTTKPGAYDQAVKLAGKYATDPLDRELKRAQIDSANRANQPSGEDAPILKDINGQTKQWDSKTNSWIEPTSTGGTGNSPLILERGADRLKQVDSLLTNAKGLNANAGLWTRTSAVNLQNSRDWQADIKNLVSRLTVDELGRIKADGVTFGALSDPERKAVGDAASVLSAGMVMEDDGVTPTGRFSISESRVRDALKEIKKYQELDFKYRNGITPEEYAAKKYVDSINPVLEEVTSPYSMYLSPGQFNSN